MSDTTPRPDEQPAVEQPEAPQQPTVEQPPAPPQPTYEQPPAPPQPTYEQPPAPPQPTYEQPPAPPQPTYEQPQYAQQQLPPPYPPPRPAMAPPNPMSPADERTTGLAAHGVALGATVLSGGFLGFVAALVMYLVYRDRGPFVRHHAANALNVQIIAGIVMLVSLPLMLVLIGFVTFAAAWLFAVVVHVIGMVKANNGEWWNPPMTPQFVK